MWIVLRTNWIECSKKTMNAAMPSSYFLINNCTHWIITRRLNNKNTPFWWKMLLTIKGKDTRIRQTTTTATNKNNFPIAIITTIEKGRRALTATIRSHSRRRRTAASQQIQHNNNNNNKNYYYYYYSIIIYNE